MPPRPIEWIAECFVEYQRRLRDIQEVTTCPCRACTNVGSLTLKFVANHGEYLPQRFADKETYVGRDVNIVHRLLKITVPSREYLLVTAAFLEHMPATAHTGLVPHVERYDAGEVSGAYLDLAAPSDQRAAVGRVRSRPVEPEAQLHDDPRTALARAHGSRGEAPLDGNEAEAH